MQNNTVFDDIMQGLHEVEEYQKGNIQLRASVAETPDFDTGSGDYTKERHAVFDDMSVDDIFAELRRRKA
ncbi:MAG: hypothetical protein FWG70_06935 [Oscillospiraceae bacterium]|nr:hypothetical protein [Oscillospiraceae bacterium]